MAAPHFLSIPDAKRAARQAALAARAGVDPGLGRAVLSHLLTECPPPSGAVVAGFWPMGDEIDIRPVLHALHGRGHRVVLPETPARGQPLVFRRWFPGDVLLPGRFGTHHPAGQEEEQPDWLLVPLLAFDADGNRLGYGAGYYDRTLARLPGRTAVGCAYACQQVPAVPVGPSDVPLHAVVTEHGVIRPERS